MRYERGITWDEFPFLDGDGEYARLLGYLMNKDALEAIEILTLQTIQDDVPDLEFQIDTESAVS